MQSVATELFQRKTFKLVGTHLVPKRKTFRNLGKKNTTTMTEKSKTPTGASSEKFDKTPLPDKIGTSLRSLYDEVLKEDVPDDFLDLLRKADDKPRPSSEADQ